MDFRQAVEWLRENTTDMETAINQTVPGVYAGEISVRYRGQLMSVSCVAASQQDVLQKLALDLYAKINPARRPITPNARECTICGGMADLYLRYYECTANPFHMADRNTGIFADLTP